MKTVLNWISATVQISLLHNIIEFPASTSTQLLSYRYRRQYVDSADTNCEQRSDCCLLCTMSVVPAVAEVQKETGSLCGLTGQHTRRRIAFWFLKIFGDSLSGSSPLWFCFVFFFCWIAASSNTKLDVVQEVLRSLAAKTVWLGTVTLYYSRCHGVNPFAIVGCASRLSYMISRILNTNRALG